VTFMHLITRTAVVRAVLEHGRTSKQEYNDVGVSRVVAGGVVFETELSPCGARLLARPRGIMERRCARLLPLE
jgi:hypothetical protein